MDQSNGSQIVPVVQELSNLFPVCPSDGLKNWDTNLHFIGKTGAPLGSGFTPGTSFDTYSLSRRCSNTSSLAHLGPLWFSIEIGHPVNTD